MRIMNRILIAALCLLISTVAFTQNRIPAPSSIGVFLDSEDWIQLNTAINVSGDQFFNRYATDMGLSSQDEMQLEEAVVDDLGWIHYKYQQHYKGVPVEFAIYNIHDFDGRSLKGNGKLAREVRADMQLNIDKEEALELALECFGAESYYWENERLEILKQYSTGDDDATFYPEGELVVSDSDFDSDITGQYALAWKFDISAERPEGRKWIYINATTGEVHKELDLNIHTEGHVGTAETRYSGTQEIITDSTENGYVLRDYTRGRGIETFDALDSFTAVLGYDFYDDDNYWDNSNDRADDAATDAHWASEQLYDYLKETHGFDSYDNKGSKMISLVHAGQNWYNAQWQGFWSRYGDAGGDPWTNIDVVGHEFAHGISWSTSALLYTKESGAMNESFSDIIGEALERYAQGENDWVATPAPIDTIRNYIDPNLFGHPDTYLGDHWFTGSGDNFGVHTNSSVQNHWFYLLSVGAEGVNDNGDQYAVLSIGFDAAMAVMWRMMTTYLTPTSGYYDARQAALFAAEDIFGTCSFEYQQIANAWHAVGVGERVDNKDFSVLAVEPYDLCGLGETEYAKIWLKHMGCDSTDSLTVNLKLTKTNPIKIVTERLSFPNGVAPGEVIEYVFSEPFDFSRKGEHVLTGSVGFIGDLNEENDASDPVSAFNMKPVESHRFTFYLNIAPNTFRDSLAFFSEDFASIGVLPNVGRDSTVGIRMEGARSRYASPISPGEDLFDSNEKQTAMLCMCVDAYDLDSLGLQFDLRQTYSSDFEEKVGIDQPKTSALRVMIDTTELGRYFPETNRDDDWATQNLDLNDYLGTAFTLCFESKTLVSQAEDPDTTGDRVFLDNIELIGSKVQSSVLNIPQVEELSVFPNPTSGKFVIQHDAPISGQALVQITTLSGGTVYQQQHLLQAGLNTLEINSESLPPGMYFTELRADGRRYIAKLIVQ